MKTLLSAIKAQLQTSITYVRDADVFVTENENIIPNGVSFPAIAIKDGPVLITELAGGLMDQTLRVRIIPMVQLYKPEAAVMGDAGRKGVLDMADDIMAALDENLLTIDGMAAAYPDADQPESELFGDDTTAIVRKIVNFVYEHEGERP